MEKTIGELKVAQVMLLKMIEQHPKHKGLHEITRILTNSIEVIEIENQEVVKEVLITDIEDHRFIKRESKEKDIEVYKLSTVSEDEYIFVQTIRLYQHEVKYMINNTNLNVFAKDWYNKYIS